MGCSLSIESLSSKNSEVKMQKVCDSVNQVKSQWLMQLNLIPMVCVIINCQKA